MDTLNKQQPTGASPVTTVEVVMPAAFKNHAPDMSATALALAIQVGEKHPQIVRAVTELGKSLAVVGEKYYQVLHTLRHAKLQKKEATALLLGLGLTKGRASELNKLSSCSDEVWAKYSAKAIGFRAALALENGEVPPGEPGEGEDASEKEAPKPREKHKIHTLPKPVSKALAEALLPWLARDSTLPRPNKSDKRTEYGFTIEADGRTLYIQIFADKAD